MATQNGHNQLHFEINNMDVTRLGLKKVVQELFLVETTGRSFITLFRFITVFFRTDSSPRNIPHN